MTCSCPIGGNGVTEPVEAEHTQECVAESELSEREAPEGEWLSDCCNCQAIGELSVTEDGATGLCAFCKDRCSFSFVADADLEDCA